MNLMLVWVLGDKVMHGSYLMCTQYSLREQFYQHQTLYGEINKLVSCPHVFFCIIKIIIKGKPTAHVITGSLVQYSSQVKSRVHALRGMRTRSGLPCEQHTRQHLMVLAIVLFFQPYNMLNST